MPPIPWEEVVAITLLTVQVAALGTLAGALVGVPLGAWLALREDVARRALRVLVYALYGLPPVVAGLVLYLLLGGSGPLAFLGLLYTPWAIALGEFVLATPLVAGLTAAALGEVPASVREVVKSAGAAPATAALALAREAKAGILAGVMVAFGRALAEVAAAAMLGGNVRHETRTLGTAILQEVAQGRFGFALALGGVLLALALVTFYALHRLERATEEAPA